MSRLRNHAIAALIMPVGATAVLGAVVAMNEFSEPPEKQKVERGTAIEVKRPPPPKKKEEVKKPKPKPKPRSNRPPPPSLAALTSGLAGVAFDLPAFQMEDIGANAGELLGGGQDVVHTGDTVDKKPQPTSQPPGSFPPSARKRGVEGYVLLSVLVNKNGKVSEARVLESKPPGEFDEAALAAIRSWTFQPGFYKGEPTSVRIEQKIEFRLK
ncbi:MAG: energy transducer TonB [Myxococcota bacterium]